MLSFISPFHVLTCNRDVCWEYGKTYRYQRDECLLIGRNDLWIAAVAIACGMPVATRKEQHFRRIPGLQLLSYVDELTD